MNWNDHSRLVGQHAFLGASKYHWINYDAARLAETYASYQAKENGIRLHAFAAECIALGQKLPKSKKTLNAYVNDAIGFRMTPEQVLYLITVLARQIPSPLRTIYFESTTSRPELFLHIWSSSLFMMHFSVWSTAYTRRTSRSKTAFIRTMMFLRSTRPRLKLSLSWTKSSSSIKSLRN